MLELIVFSLLLADHLHSGFESRMTRREASLILELPYVPSR